MIKNPQNNGGGQEDKPLAQEWCLWEQYQSTQYNNRSNYDQNMKVIYSFDSLKSLGLLWKHTTYCKPSRLFFDKVNSKIKKIILFDKYGDDKESVVLALFLFKKGIHPSWED